jgi:hypothetical protein
LVAIVGGDGTIKGWSSSLECSMVRKAAPFHWYLGQGLVGLPPGWWTSWLFLGECRGDGGGCDPPSCLQKWEQQHLAQAHTLPTDLAGPRSRSRGTNSSCVSLVRCQDMRIY